MRNWKIAYVLLGLFSFAGGAGILGAWLRSKPSQANAENASRVVHALFFAGLVGPGIVAVLPPGLSRFDRTLGLPSLPFRRPLFALGLILALPGLYLLGASNKALRALGSGANAFRLTRRLVSTDLYRYTRNPMSLGSYLLWASSGLLSGSTFVTLVALLGMIPAHLFSLKYFEELELEFRFGDAYRDYRRRVPFLFPRLNVDDESRQVKAFEPE